MERDTHIHKQKHFRKKSQSNGSWMVKQNSWLESGCLATSTTIFLPWPHGLIFFFKTLIIAGDYPVVWISDSLCVFVRLFCLTGSSQLAFTLSLCREDTLDHLPSLFGPAQNGGPQVVNSCSGKQKSITNSFLKWRRMGCWWAEKTDYIVQRYRQKN